MKFFKTHLSLILPLLFMMFAFEFVLVVNATLKHYETLLNRDYNIVIVSSTQLEEGVLKTQIPALASLEKLDPKELIERLKKDISERNLSTLQNSLPNFYSLKLERLFDQDELEALKKKLLDMANITKVETFEKTHTQIYSLLVLFKFIFWLFLFVIFLLSFILFLKQMKIWLYEHSQRVEIMCLFGAPFWFRSQMLYRLVFVDCLFSYLFLLVFFTQLYDLDFVKQSLASVDIFLPKIDFFFDLSLVFVVVLLVCFICVNSVMFKVKR